MRDQKDSAERLSIVTRVIAIGCAIAAAMVAVYCVMSSMRPRLSSITGTLASAGSVVLLVHGRSAAGLKLS